MAIERVLSRAYLNQIITDLKGKKAKRQKGLIVFGQSLEHPTIMKERINLNSDSYRISSNKTRGYYFFNRPSTEGIIRMRVLFEG